MQHVPRSSRTHHVLTCPPMLGARNARHPAHRCRRILCIPGKKSALPKSPRAKRGVACSTGPPRAQPLGIGSPWPPARHGKRLRKEDSWSTLPRGQGRLPQTYLSRTCASLLTGRCRRSSMRWPLSCVGSSGAAPRPWAAQTLWADQASGCESSEASARTSAKLRVSFRRSPTRPDSVAPGQGT